LKVWLAGLDDDDIRLLIAIPGPLRFWVNIPTRKGGVPKLGRRGVLSVRAWLSRAPVRDLNTIAEEATDFSCHMLTERGDWAAESFENPDLTSLEAVIGALPHVLAGLTLHSYLTRGSTSRRALVEEHWDHLLEVAKRPADDFWSRAHDEEHEHDELHAREADEPQLREEDTGGAVKARDTEDPEAVAGPEAALEELRSQAAQFAEALGQAAQCVAEGLDLPPDLLEQAMTWSASRSTVTNLVQEAGHVWALARGSPNSRR
jgi:hypothetical protein